MEINYEVYNVHERGYQLTFTFKDEKYILNFNVESPSKVKHADWVELYKSIKRKQRKRINFYYEGVQSSLSTSEDRITFNDVNMNFTLMYKDCIDQILGVFKSFISNKDIIWYYFHNDKYESSDSSDDF